MSIEEQAEELEKFRLQWLMFIDEMQNGNNSDAHWPPAVQTGCFSILRSFAGDQDSMWEAETVDEIRLIFTPVSAASLLATIFMFSQKAMINGLYAANMTQCDCGKITDEDIQKLVGNWEQK